MTFRSSTKVFSIIAGCVLGSGAGVSQTAVSQLPEAEREIYQVVDPRVPLGDSAYKDFKAKKGPPWKIGYASSYAGNTYRANALDELMNVLVPASKKAGLVSDVIVTQSDLKDAVQIQQMRQLVDQGVDAIIICCSNATALNPTIEYANQRGVPVFSFSGYTTSPYSINAAANHAQGGYEAAKWLFKEIGGKGDVLQVSGIPGAASNDSFNAGVDRALKEFPNVKVVGKVNGNWTDQIAQVEVQKFLASNPRKIDGILTQGAQENGVLNALLQSGRPMVPLNVLGQASISCYWRKHPNFVSTGYHVWPPRREMDQIWDIMLRTLGGEGPKVQTFLRPVLPYTIDDVKAALPEDCDLNSTSYVEPTASGWFPPQAAEHYFEHYKK